MLETIGLTENLEAVQVYEAGLGQQPAKYTSAL
jgi:hypothetical protein